MSGFIVGVVCLVLFVALGRWSRHRRGWHRGGWRRGWGAGRWPEVVAARISHVIDASPEQREVIASAVRRVRDAAEPLRADRDGMRTKLAESLRGDEPPREAVSQLGTRWREGLDTMVTEVGGALDEIHAVLRPEQRKRLAVVVERFGGRHRC